MAARRALAVDLIGKYVGWQTRELGVVAVAEHLQGVAKGFENTPGEGS